ncbi:hypothetical protein DC31_11840 [Microbacterium sp. CH12i]|uniref:hypothetical protein n=1 Tax=Microbacterium sp. CH12i TaxID=1479651 RepID=UPI000460EEA0|nr:hypothetical protein [Microbacterium sp. CH12i]KDA05955.1 hypothetical protein DC31_11840 [Microbacterium sp. CH12i]
MIAKSDDRAHNCVELTRLGDGAWRACDASMPEDHPEHVVAFIERRNERFEVVWLRGSTVNREFEHLEGALDAVCDVIGGAESRSTRPIQIPHAPPVTRQGRSPR